MKTHLSVILFFISTIFAVALPAPVSFQTSIADYTIYSEQQINSDDITLFNEAFTTAAEEVFTRFNLKMPERFRVTICNGAWIFRQLTGLDEQTAGVYLPVRGEFVFQRSAALSQKGIFVVTLRHELCHAAFARAREDNGVSEDTARAHFYMEESFCTALYPAGEYSLLRGRALVAKMGEAGVRAFLEKGLSSASKSKRKDAYAVAYAYGLDLINQYGERKLFEMIAANNEK
jgi:hypothetical protein